MRASGIQRCSGENGPDLTARYRMRSGCPDDRRRLVHHVGADLRVRPGADTSVGPYGVPGRFAGTCPRFHTMNVRLNSMTVVPCWLTPVVFTWTMPAAGRDFDSRASRTSLRE